MNEALRIGVSTKKFRLHSCLDKVKLMLVDFGSQGWRLTEKGHDGVLLVMGDDGSDG